MGGTCSRQKPMKFFIQGLDAAGKTSILYTLKLGEIITTIPTIGFNVESLYSGGIEIVAWDVGGRDKMRPLYRHYYPGTDGFIYVIDSADVERVDEALDELTNFVLQSEEVQGVVMVIANKQDLEGALSPAQIESKIQEKCCFTTGVSLFVMPCSVVTGDGLQDSFDHLVKQVKLKQEGKLPPGLIPSAWETSNKNAGNKEDGDVIREEHDAPNNFHRIKNSLFKNPLDLFKSFIFY